DPLDPRAVLAHAPFQASPELHVGCAQEVFDVGIAADLLMLRDGQALLLGDPAITGGERVPIARTQRGQPYRARRLLERDLGAELLAVRLGARQLAVDLGPDTGIVPGDKERAAALDPPEHVHMAALVF